MRRRCEDCGRSYDDAVFLTICPHDRLVGGGGYCKHCDLFHDPVTCAESRGQASR